MKRFGSSVAGMMALILAVAVGFAALRDGKVLWASATFSLSVTLLATAILAACAARGPARLAWGGFALFGWAYLGIAFGPLPNGNGASIPPLPTMAAYELLLDAKWRGMASEPRRLLNNREPRGEVFLGRMGAYANAHMSGSFEIAYESGSLVDGVAPSALPRVLDALQLRRIVHALEALAFGLLGAAIGRGLAAWYDRPGRRADAPPAA